MTNPHRFATTAGKDQAHLRILATSDLHMHILPYDYFADKPADQVGLARTATQIAHAREGAKNTVLFDNGDFLQGNPMGDLLALERREEIHPMIQAMNLLDYNAVNLGNHEFNYGLDFLNHATAGANFPILCANVEQICKAAHGDTSRPCVPDQRFDFKPYTLIKRQLECGAGELHPFTIGVLGILPPQVMLWDKTHLSPYVTATDAVETVARFVPEMRAAGADLIVVLNHSGIGEEKAYEGIENTAIPVAAIDGVDAQILGHLHAVFPSKTGYADDVVNPTKGLIHNKPAVMPGVLGDHLGVIDFLVERHGTGWRIAGQEAAVTPLATHSEHSPNVATTTPKNQTQRVQGADSALLDATRKFHTQTLDYIRKPVGKSDQKIHSYFSMVRYDLSLQLVAQAQIDYARRELLGSSNADLPLISAMAPFKAGGRAGPESYIDIAAGPIALKDVASLYPYPNTINALKLSGAQLREWLERSASVFNTMRPSSQAQPLHNEKSPSYFFDVLYGLEYEIDLSQPARYDNEGNLQNPTSHRITSLMHADAAVDDDMSFHLVTNSYRAGGGGNFPGAIGNAGVLAGRETLREVLIDYISKQGNTDTVLGSTWRFAPMPGCTAYFDSSPRAEQHLDDLAEISRNGQASVLAHLDSGFTRYTFEP